MSKPRIAHDENEVTKFLNDLIPFQLSPSITELEVEINSGNERLFFAESLKNNL